MLLLILLLALGPSAPAPVQHVSVATSVDPSPDKANTFMLFVDVVPMPKIHVYAPGAKDYVPITIKLTTSSGVAVGKITYPKSELLLLLNEIVPVFQKPFRLTQEIKIEPSPAKPVKVTGTVEYQACDDHICFPRETIPVSWTIPAGKAGQ